MWLEGHARNSSPEPGTHRHFVPEVLALGMLPGLMPLLGSAQSSLRFTA
jgi:hypothetical protein